jgi:hypothetical protein
MRVISEHGCNFVCKLLKKKPAERLRSRENPEQIKEHPFFKSIDWTQLENGGLEPPIKPMYN